MLKVKDPFRMTCPKWTEQFPHPHANSVEMIKILAVANRRVVHGAALRTPKKGEANAMFALDCECVR